MAESPQKKSPNETLGDILLCRLQAPRLLFMFHAQTTKCGNNCGHVRLVSCSDGDFENTNMQIMNREKE